MECLVYVIGVKPVTNSGFGSKTPVVFIRLINKNADRADLAMEGWNNTASK